MAQKERKVRFCIMPPCHGQRFDLVHKFPMEKDRVDCWLAAVDLPELYFVPLPKLRSSYFICSRHFRSQDYKNVLSRNLNKTAVPCINLKTLDQLDSTQGRCRPHPPPPTTTLIQNANPTMSTEFTILDDSSGGLRLKKLRKSNQIPVSNHYTTELDIECEIPTTKSKDEVDVFGKIFFEMKDEHSLHSIEADTEMIEQEEFQAESSYSELQDQDVDVLYDVDEVNGDAEEAEVQEESSVVLDNQNGDSLVYSESAMASTLLEIRHPDYPSVLSLDNIWLRDHCRCTLCYNTVTHQRKQDILEIPLDVKPVETETRDNLLLIQWSDGHLSQYDFNFLYKSQVDVSKENDGECTAKIFWDQDKVHQFDYGRVIFNNLLTDDAVAKAVVKSLVQFGFAFIEKVPPNANMTEAAIRRLFPIQRTFFGDNMWTFSDEKDHSDTAYTKDYLGSHTDNTYFNDAAGLEVLHCIKHAGSGGETFLVDGFKILDDLKRNNPKAYNRLSTVNIPAEFIEDGTHYSHTAPIINIDPITQSPVQIRYNVYDRSVFNTIPQSEMFEFYRDFRALAQEINTEKNQWQFKLNPGTILIFDNWRVLHGRQKYSGKRQLTGCYVSRSEFLNTARVMGLIS